METCIVHFDMDTFFVSVEQRADTSLKGKPVLIGGYSDRAVVASCSYEARQYGIRSGMSMKMALALCKDAIVRRGDMDLYSKVSDEITDILRESAPVTEKSSIDEFYLDISGMDRFLGAQKWAQELRKRIIKHTHLPMSSGLSVNKTVSKIATGKAKPNNEIMVSSGTERNFLAPLPVRKIPGVGEQTSEQLGLLGVKTIKQVQDLSVNQMEAVLQKNGRTIWEKANGIDDSPVVPYSEQKSMSREETFEQDTMDLVLLRKTILKMVGELAFDLRQLNRLASTVTVKIRYSNWDTESKQGKIVYSSIDDVIGTKALELFHKLYERRMMIRLIGVKLNGFVNGNYQIDLFGDTQTNLKLYQALDGIKKRYGADAITKAIIR
ncbi:DNA polymerase IV [Chitinophaga rhizophila]|uniref:DNA polymerase IV n=1 Tax=Chitinophaga rhizophila TaxID=2866212 RepID=A0ABS7G747_9BACT|nr:DNA polymerase IV [Chitinophaga rhizophila]MBW8683483.1 DNA polymerase IV [Chitinophaga rhizophila]